MSNNFYSLKITNQTNRIFKKISKFSLIVLLFAIVAAGCETMTKSQKGAVIGGTSGAVVGGVIGKVVGNTAMGAIIGATVGGVTGAVIGRNMDKQAEELAKEMKDAEIIREGEAIVVKFKEQVLFAYDRSDLSATAKTNLDKFNDILKRYPETNITIIGHTDSKGSETYNQNLSEKRAESVTNYAGMNGIAGTRLTTIGKGESDPIATNDTDEGRALNRRVEFVITANDKMKADAKAESGK
jgi:outer membrane protein OmpA-like peptidoglycan-associated protein